MKIKRILAKNYKSLFDTGWVEIAEAFTVVFGKNNSGKSSFLEAFRLWENQSVPHKSTKVPAGLPMDAPSVFNVEIEFSGTELKQAMIRHGGNFCIPMYDASVDESAEYLRLLLEKDSIVVRYRSLAGGNLLLDQRMLWDPRPAEGVSRSIICSVNEDKTDVLFAKTRDLTADESVRAVQQMYHSSVFFFNSERFNIGKWSVSDTDRLRSNAQNLPAMVLKLNKNRRLIEKYERYVKQVFPEIQAITVSQMGNEAELYIYNEDTDRADLAMRVSESGTGVSQVLAIMYVLMEMKEGVIVIDEPSSFLHPGAAKALNQVLRLFPSHQFVIATHSSEAVNTLRPETILLSRWSEGSSRLESISIGEVEGIQVIIDEVGAALSDVFGLDAVIWVEGPTEQRVFPLLLEGFFGLGIVGVSFVAVRATGDFISKRRGNSRLVWEVYTKLAEGGALIPAAVAFSFDREEYTEIEMTDLTRASRNKAHFLPRRTLENFLLAPDAISAALLALGEAEEGCGAEVVATLLERRLFAHIEDPTDDQRRHVLATCNAAVILQELFQDLTESRQAYDKIRDSVFISSWLLEKDKEVLRELAEYVMTLVPEERRFVVER